MTLAKLNNKYSPNKIVKKIHLRLSLSWCMFKCSCFWSLLAIKGGDWHQQLKMANLTRARSKAFSFIIYFRPYSAIHLDVSWGGSSFWRCPLLRFLPVLKYNGTWLPLFYLWYIWTTLIKLYCLHRHQNFSAWTCTASLKRVQMMLCTVCHCSSFWTAA